MSGRLAIHLLKLISMLVLSVILVACGGGGSSPQTSTPPNDSTDGPGEPSDPPDPSDPAVPSEPSEPEQPEDPSVPDVEGEDGDAPPSNTDGPTANAGGAQQVLAGEWVWLEASRSSDPSGLIASYRWAQSSGPDVELSSANTHLANFEAPFVTSMETLVFQLTVTDYDGLSSSDSVEITISPAYYKGSAIQLNPDGHGLSMVDNIRLGDRNFFITWGSDEQGDRALYFTGGDWQGFHKIPDNHEVDHLGAVQRRLFNHWKPIPTGNGVYGLYDDKSIYVLAAANLQPSLGHVWTYDGPETFRSDGGFNLPDGFYFVGETENEIAITDNIYHYYNGITKITSYELPEEGGIGATFGPDVRATPSSIFYKLNWGGYWRVKEGEAREITFNGQEFYPRDWAGYTIGTGGAESIYVTGYENNDEANSHDLALFRIEGTAAVQHDNWDDFDGEQYSANLQYIGNYGGIAYSRIRDLESRRYRLISINPQGTVTEVHPPEVDGEPIEITPIMADQNGVWFGGSRGGLWFRNVNGWQSVGLGTGDRFLQMGDYYLASGVRYVVEDGESKAERGIYKISMDATSMIPQVELVWESLRDLERLTYFEGKLYFKYKGSQPRRWQGTLYIPYNK